MYKRQEQSRQNIASRCEIVCNRARENINTPPGSDPEAGQSKLTYVLTQTISTRSLKDLESTLPGKGTYIILCTLIKTYLKERLIQVISIKSLQLR